MRRRNPITYYTINKRRRSAIEDPRVWLRKRYQLNNPYMMMLQSLNPLKNKTKPWQADTAFGRLLQSRTPAAMRLINNAVNYVKTKTNQGRRAISSKAKSIAQNAANTVGNAIDATTNAATTAIDAGKDALVKVWDTGRNAASAAWDATANAASTALHIGEQTRNAIIGAVGRAYQGTPLSPPTTNSSSGLYDLPDPSYFASPEAWAIVEKVISSKNPVVLDFLNEQPETSASSHVTVSETENSQKLQAQIQHKDQTEQEATLPQPQITVDPQPQIMVDPQTAALNEILKEYGVKQNQRNLRTLHEIVYYYNLLKTKDDPLSRLTLINMIGRRYRNNLGLIADDSRLLPNVSVLSQKYRLAMSHK